MARRTIVDYIIEGRQRGFQDEVLKDDLLDNGFSEDVVDDAFYQLDYQMNLRSQEDSGWSSDFGSDNSQKMPNLPQEEKPLRADSRKESGYDSGAIEGIKKRGWGLVLVLTILTLGIYGIYWTVSTTKELRKNTDSAPSPKWLWLIVGLIVLSVLASSGLFFQDISSLLSLVGSILSLAATLVLIYYYVFYALAINELSGFSKIGIIVLWVLLPIVAMPVSQAQLNKFADK